MSKLSWTCALGALLLAQSVTATVDVCKSLPTPTATWLTSCETFDVQNSASCWSTGKVPTSTDTVMFPAHTNVSLHLTRNSTFHLFEVANMVIAEKALVSMAWAAFQIAGTGCLVVEGNLTMDPQAGNFSGSDTSPETNGTQYLADPAVPENTDCALLPVGFVPRICGPGMMRIAPTGRVVMRNSYASLFITTVVEEGGNLEAGEWSFVWANVTNHGTLTSKSWVYMHGFVFNHGVATFDVVVFDKWATKFVESPPIIMENHGQMSFSEDTHNTATNYTLSAPRHQRFGTYKAAVVNYGNLNFTLGEAHASTYFDLFNYGTTLWNCYGDQWGQWRGGGNYINHGTFVTSNPTVYLGTYYSMGGTLRTEGNGGGFVMGNGATDPRSVKLCVLSQHAPLKDSPVKKALPRVRPPTLTVEQRDGCWWYGSFCYQTPYVWNIPQVQMPTNGVKSVETGKHSNLEKSVGLMRGVSIALETAIRRAPIPQSCSRRYVFEGKSKITGTGKGSVLTTLPVAVEGTLEVSNGGKWYAMTENQQPPVFGGGKVRVRPSGEMFLGLDSAFTHDGVLQVDQGGLLAIPRQSKVAIANHTIVIRPGAIFHVDGQLSTHAKSAALKNCGELRGRGKITKSKDEDMKC